MTHHRITKKTLNLLYTLGKTIFLLLFIQEGMSQEAKGHQQFEFGVNVAYTLKKEGAFTSNTGYGVYALGIKRVHKIIKITYGFELAQTSQFRSRAYGGRFTYFENMTYKNLYISLPLGLRIPFGKHKNNFIQGGGFAALFMYGKSHGLRYYYDPFTSDPSSFSNEPYSGSTKFRNTAGVFLAYGRSINLQENKINIYINFRNARAHRVLVSELYYLRTLELGMSVSLI